MPSFMGFWNARWTFGYNSCTTGCSDTSCRNTSMFRKYSSSLEAPELHLRQLGTLMRPWVCLGNKFLGGT